MRARLAPEIEAGRVTIGAYASRPESGIPGAFTLRLPGCRPLRVIASNGGGWEHVSVSVVGQPDSTPTWAEMCAVKAAFWAAEETVVQYHPPQSRYVNRHEGCLHLWRPIAGPGIPLPPLWMV